MRPFRLLLGEDGGDLPLGPDRRDVGEPGGARERPIGLPLTPVC
jgi:hypothetical protein